MTDYTDKWGLPKPGLDDLIAGTTENLRLALSALADKTDQGLSGAADEAIVSANSNYGDLPDRMGMAEQKIAPIQAWDNNNGSEDEGLRILDSSGAVALEVKNGTTYIYDLADGEGSGGQGTAVTEWHAFLAVGQSNMSGSGMPYSSELDLEDLRILQYGAKNRSIRPATVPLDMHDSWVRGMSPATGFAREYLRQQPSNIGVLLIPAARSGTAFTDDPDTWTWRPHAASAPEWDLYGQSVQQTLAALDEIGATGKLKGVLWHQGEGNSYMSTTEYAEELDALIQSYRTDLDDPDLPFMVGQMSQERIESHPVRWQVDRAHAATPARVPRTGFAPSEWGWASYDETHFGRTGALKMGKRFVDAYWQALGNTEASQLLPPVNVNTHRVGDKVTVTWASPSTRVTGYQIRTRPIGATEWTALPRDWPMYLSETFTAADPIEIEVTSQHATEVSTRVLASA